MVNGVVVRLQSSLEHHLMSAATELTEVDLADVVPTEVVARTYRTCPFRAPFTASGMLTLGCRK